MTAFRFGLALTLAAMSGGLAAGVFAQPAPAAGSKITIALIGEDQVPNNKQPWMRSTMAATFEDVLVGTRRFRVVSQSVLTKALEQQKIAVGGSVDPSQAIEIGKIVQARYVVIVKQLRADVKQSGPIVKRSVLDLAIQAQVINIQTTDIAESQSYPRNIPLEGWGGALSRGKDEPMPEDKLGPKYAEVMKEVATEFVTSAAVNLMPLETVVAAVTPTNVILEAGSGIGVAVGGEFDVMKEGETLTLSDGRKIPQFTRAGRIRVTRVEPEISYAQVVETFSEAEAKDPVANPQRLKKGMTARFAPIVPAAPKKR